MRRAQAAVAAAEERAARATARAFSAELEAQARIDAVAEPRRCSLCGILIPSDCDEASHPVDFGSLYPRERDAYRAAHPSPWSEQ